jgi:endonuclease/exonuclease/phosphatase family metal-dependent hydrolase
MLRVPVRAFAFFVAAVSGAVLAGAIVRAQSPVDSQPTGPAGPAGGAQTGTTQPAPEGNPPPSSAVDVSGAPESRRRVRVPAIPSDLLEHSPLSPCDGGVASPTDGKHPLRAATWNIKAARAGSLEAIAEEMKAMQADIIALQEVDVRTRRGGFVDQPVELAAALGYHYAFAASIKWDEGDYGLAVLSRWPLVDVRRHRLEGTDVGEPRIILEVVVCAAGRPLRVFNHHADGRASYRQSGFETLRGMIRPELGQGILVMGDFNEYSDAPDVRALVGEGLVDLGAERNLKTIDHGRIDYVLADTPLVGDTSTARVWTTDNSDHYAVLTDLLW